MPEQQQTVQSTRQSMKVVGIFSALNVVPSCCRDTQALTLAMRPRLRNRHRAARLRRQPRRGCPSGRPWSR
eukprot:6214374-Pleurochrysis_carterae.AAC.5